MVGKYKITRHVMYEEFAEAVMELIRKEKLWGKFMAPERDLAKLFEVSRETVRKGLAIIEKQGVITRRQGSGTFVLPRTKSRRAGSAAGRRIMVGSYQYTEGSGTFGGELMAGLTAAAAQLGQLLEFVNLTTPVGRQKVFKDLASGTVDGLLLASISDRQLVEELLRSWRGPMVLADHYFEGLPVTGVVDDSLGGARQVMDHLIALGHRRIGYVEIAQREMNPWRYAGYSEALQAAGIGVDSKLLASAFGSFESGRVAGESLLSMANPPTAIFAFDDVRAWGVWRAAEAHGLEVGGNFALAGFGDTAAKAGFPEELTSVHFDYRGLGRVAIEKLSEQIEGTAKPGELVKLPTRLVVRKSTKNARVEAGS